LHSCDRTHVHVALPQIGHIQLPAACTQSYSLHSSAPHAPTHSVRSPCPVQKGRAMHLSWLSRRLLVRRGGGGARQARPWGACRREQHGFLQFTRMLGMVMAGVHPGLLQACAGSMGGGASSSTRVSSDKVRVSSIIAAASSRRPTPFLNASVMIASRSMSRS